MGASEGGKVRDSINCLILYAPEIPGKLKKKKVILSAIEFSNF